MHFNKSYLNFVLMLLLLIGMAFTKMHGLALAPILLFFLLLLYGRGGGSSVKFFVLLFIFGLAFSVIYLTYSGHYTLLLEHGVSTSGFVVSSIGPRLGDYANHVPYAYLRLFNYPPNECLNQQLFGAFNELLKLLFIAITFPLFILCVKGVVGGFKGNLFWKMLSSAAVFNFGIIILEYLQLTFFILPRYLIPTIALTGILATREYTRIGKPWLKRIVLISFALFAIYTLSYSAYSTTYHYKVYALHEPSIEFVSTLPKESIVIASFMAERIKFYSHRNVHQYRGNLAAENIDYIYYGCYWENIDANTLRMLQDVNSITRVYADDCTRVYKILHYPDTNSLKTQVTTRVTGSNITPKVDECH